MSADYVLNSSSASFSTDFKDLAQRLNATACIECVGGAMTGRLMEGLPANSTVIFYGALSEEGPCEMDPFTMKTKNIKLEAFILGHFLSSKGIWILSTISECNTLMANKLLWSKI